MHSDMNFYLTGGEAGWINEILYLIQTFLSRLAQRKKGQNGRKMKNEGINQSINQSINGAHV
jgi:hypothetical protein